MNGTPDAALDRATTPSGPATSGAARLSAHLSVGLVGLLLGALAGAVVALALGLVQFQC